MANPPSKANSGFPGRQNQPFPSTSNSIMGNPQLASVSVNSCNMMQNHMQMPNMLQSPVMPVPNMPQPITRPVFSGASGNYVPLQTNQPFPPQMGLLGSTSQLGQFNMGFNHGNGVNNVNSVALLALLGQLMQNSAQVNLSQSQGQLFNPGFIGGPQQQQQLCMNMNMNMPNGQCLSPGVMQNLSQLVSMQGFNPSQVAPHGVLPCPQPVFGALNQVSQGMIPQAANNFNTNPLFGVGQHNQAEQLWNQNSGNFVSSVVNENGLSPSIFPSQLQGNISGPHGSGLVPGLRPAASANSEGNPVRSSRAENSESNWEDSPRKKFMKKPIGGEFQRGTKKFMKKPNGGQFEGGFQKFKSCNVNDAGRKLGFPEKHTGKGPNMKNRKQFDSGDSPPENKGQKGSFHFYSEEEIKQWCESRRNNYPSKQNVEKKQREKLNDSELMSRETQLKNELAEILLKQAKLGVEVAELAPEYLLHSVQRGQGSKENTKMSPNNGRNRSKFNKRQGYNKKDRFGKKQKLDSELQSNDNPSKLLGEIHREQIQSGAAEASNYTPHAAKQDDANQDRNRFSAKDKFNKREGYNKKGRFDKQNRANKNQPANCVPKKEPTLLQKLLGADISRDKRQLFQVFRFMVMNSFFKDWPDKPLTYPSVIVDGIKHECDAEE